MYGKCAEKSRRKNASDGERIAEKRGFRDSKLFRTLFAFLRKNTLKYVENRKV